MSTWCDTRAFLTICACIDVLVFLAVYLLEHMK